MNQKDRLSDRQFHEEQIIQYLIQAGRYFHVDKAKDEAVTHLLQCGIMQWDEDLPAGASGGPVTKYIPI